MKKKLILVFAVIALVAVLTSCLVACNKGFKWHSVGGGDATAAVVSNGGYAVKQGDYLYFVNGYVGLDENNDFGTPVKQSIVRVKLVNGVPDNSTAVVVVPKSVYNTSSKGGFAIYGEWIYYVTPNYDRDKNDNKSTVNSDFMRTKIDGSATQKIATISTRGADYFFAPTRVWYYTNNTLSYVDFSGMKSSGDVTDGKGAKKGSVDATISSVVWNYSLDRIFFTRNNKDENATLTYNELCSIKVDGSEEKVLATVDTYLGEGEEKNQRKAYTFALIDVYAEADGSATLYYTKSYTISEATNEGLYENKVADVFPTNEKHLTTNAPSSLYPLGYADGALAYNSASVYCWYNGEKDANGNFVDPLVVTDSTKTIWFVRDGYAYYTASSSATTLFKIAYKEAANTAIVIDEGIKVDWLKVDVVEDNFYFFATSDNNYVHYINYLTFNKDAEDAKSTMIGIYLDSEKPEEDEE